MFLNNWSNFEEMKREFWPGYTPESVYKDELDGVEILLASYGTPSCEGHAFVLFVRDGKLYEVNASHCSCYGLEEQWAPEETEKCFLQYRMTKGSFGTGKYDENPFATELKQILDNMEI